MVVDKPARRWAAISSAIEFGRQVAARRLHAGLCRPVADGQSESLCAAKFDAERDFSPFRWRVRGPTSDGGAGRPARPGPSATSSRWPAARRGQVSYGSPGTGTPPHLNAEFFKAAQAARYRCTVPYKGAAPAIIDLVDRAHRPECYSTSVRPRPRSNRATCASVGGERNRRVPRRCPNVPTFHEVGAGPLPELDPGTWWGVAAPAGLSADIKQTLQRRRAGRAGRCATLRDTARQAQRRSDARARRRSSQTLVQVQTKMAGDQARQD